MKEAEMDQIASLIDEALTARADDAALKRVKEATTALCRRFPIYPDLMADFLAAAR
jgi:glycine/serine hydroxymethyltransferase